MAYSYLPITSKENDEITNLVKCSMGFLNDETPNCTAINFPEDISERSVEEIAEESKNLYYQLNDAKSLIRKLSEWVDHLQGITEVKD